MKYILSLIFIGVFANSMTAQQLPIFSQFGDNLSLFNPGAIDHSYLTDDYTIQGSAIYRSQWLGLKGAPKTQSLLANKFLKTKTNVDLSFGGSLINDTQGPISTTSIKGRVASVFGSGDLRDGLFSAGLSLGINQYRINFSQIEFDEAELIDQENSTILYPDLGIGAYYTIELENGWFAGDLLYGGLSVPQVFALALKYEDNSDKGYTVERKPHFYGNIGLIKNYLGSRSIDMALWVKYLQSNVLQVDLMSKFHLNDQFWLGVGVSSNKALSMETGVLMSDVIGSDTGFKLTYSFINYFQKQNIFLGTSHEIGIQIMMK